MDSSNRAIEKLERRRAAIQRKINPALPEMFMALRAAEESREALKQSDRTPDRLREIQRQLDEKLDLIMRRYSGPVQLPKGTFGAEVVYSEAALAFQSESLVVAEYLHWHRHKTPLKNDLREMAAGDLEASRRVQRTFQDFETLRCGKQPVKPFKGGPDSTDHWDFFESGWGLGLEKLSPEELAYFADQYCLCGGTQHDADNLKQQRLRFKKALERAKQQ